MSGGVLTFPTAIPLIFSTDKAPVWPAPGDKSKILEGICVGGPKTTRISCDLLGGLTGLSAELDSRLTLITGKGYKAKSQREKVRGVKSRGTQAQASKIFSQWGHIGHA